MSDTRVLPPLRDTGHSIYHDSDERGELRADSVLEFYSSLPRSRDNSPSRPYENTGQVHRYATDENNNYEDCRLSNNYVYNEFGHQSKNGTAVKMQHSTAARATLGARHNETLGQASQSQTGGERFSNSQMGKSLSMSRIPVYQDPSPLTRSGSVTFQRRSGSGIQDDGTFLDNMDVVPSASRSMPRSPSVPMSQLSQPYKYTTISKSSSLSRRNSSHRSGAQSVASAAPRRYLESRDPKTVKEEQARRLHAINQAPSGSPPWIGKFQPDPRLPAEQQIIPTVARKLALQRWIEEGRAEESFDDMWKNDESMSPVDIDRHTATVSDNPSVPQEPRSIEKQASQSLEVSDAVRPQNQIVLGQSPAKVQSASNVTTNFSRRSVQGTAGSPSISTKSSEIPQVDKPVESEAPLLREPQTASVASEPAATQIDKEDSSTTQTARMTQHSNSANNVQSGKLASMKDNGSPEVKKRKSPSCCLVM